MMYKFTIAGTAGRKEDLDKLSTDLWLSARDTCAGFLGNLSEPPSLVSGGAAWMDHLAVRLFLDGFGADLTLHLPCRWDVERGQFLDTGIFDWKRNPGGVANALHQRFFERTGINSLAEIEKARWLPNYYETVSDGFHARNSLMAESDGIIALTFGDDQTVKDGGTANMCSTYLKRVKRKNLPNISWHVDLNQWPLELRKGIIIP